MACGCEKSQSVCGIVRLSGVSEVARLAAVFGDLRDRLRARTAERERAERRLRFLADASSHLAASLDYETTLERVAWLAVRPPRFRPKGPGRAHPSGVAAAAALLARHVDLGGWHPSEPTDDWASIRDAAAIDAIACAWVAHRAIHTPDSVVTIGTAARGEMVVPIDVNLGSRIALTVARLRSEGTIAI